MAASVADTAASAVPFVALLLLLLLSSASAFVVLCCWEWRDQSCWFPLDDMERLTHVLVLWMVSVLIVELVDAATGEDEYAGTEEEDVDEEANEDASADM